MLGLFERFTGQRKHHRALMRFYDEVKKNLEIYYVMDQRQFIDMEFRNKECQNIAGYGELQGCGKIQDYIAAVGEFNQFYRTFKEFEQWYAADMARKTKENAQKLHTQRSELEIKLKAMYPTICQAGEELEYRLIDLGFIKK